MTIGTTEESHNNQILDLFIEQMEIVIDLVVCGAVFYLVYIQRSMLQKIESEHRSEREKLDALIKLQKERIKFLESKIPAAVDLSGKVQVIEKYYQVQLEDKERELQEKITHQQEEIKNKLKQDYQQNLRKTIEESKAKEKQLEEVGIIAAQSLRDHAQLLHTHELLKQIFLLRRSNWKLLFYIGREQNGTPPALLIQKAKENRYLKKFSPDYLLRQVGKMVEQELIHYNEDRTLAFLTSRGKEMLKLLSQVIKEKKEID